MAIRRKSKLISVLWVAGCFIIGCGDNDTGPKDTDVERPEDSETDSETEAEWVIETVDPTNAGEDAAIALGPDGTLAAAYFTKVPYDDGICDEIDVEDPPRRFRNDLKLARKAEGDAWSVETVDSPIYPLLEGPAGLSLAFNGDGDPSVAYTGGEPDARYNYCGAGDAVLATASGSGWTMEAASTESGDSPTDREESQAGFAVGWWPALAYDPDGNPAILHKDVHFAALQGDDKGRADAEFAWRQGGGWTHEAVDPGEGAGMANELIFDAEGRPIVFYSIPVDSNQDSRHGVWASRRESDGTWQRVQIHTGSTYYRISAAMDPKFDEPVVAFYSGPDYGIKMRRFIGDEDFTDLDMWTSDIVRDPRYDEGQYVSLAFTPEGDPALAYFRCRQHDGTGDDACNANDEAVVFAVQRRGSWKREIVRTGDELECGMFASLAISETGTAHIVFQCGTDNFDEQDFALFSASKDIGASK